MAIDVELQKQVFIGLCRSVIHRNGIEDMLEWLQETDFFTAPASTKYHGAYEGGLCEHSIDVFHMAKKTAEAYSLTTLEEESLAIASFFHDLCKVDFYRANIRKQKVDGILAEVTTYSIEESFCFGGHGSKSVFLTQRYLKLTDAEAAAINCHMGFADGSPSTVRNVSSAYHAYPLAWVIHIADEAATFLLER